MTNEMEFLKNIIIKQFQVGTNEEKLKSIILDYQDFLKTSGFLTEKNNTSIKSLINKLPSIFSMYEIISISDFNYLLNELMGNIESKSNKKISLSKQYERTYNYSYSCQGGNASTNRC